MGRTAKFITVTAFIFLLAVSIVSTVELPGTACAAAEYETIITKRVGHTVSPDGLTVVELYGTYSDKSLYAKNLRISVKDKKSGGEIVEIKPVIDAGYSPAIMLGNFTNENTEQIFLGINSGGSGGFGYYYVYDVTGGLVKTLFDSENCANPFTAKYADGYKVEVADALSGKTYTIDISKKGADYLSELYGDAGKLLKPVFAEVYPVSAVFPYYNSSYGVYQLAAFRQISGLYHADGLGNIITLMRFNGKSFEPYFENVGVYGY